MGSAAAYGARREDDREQNSKILARAFARDILGDDGCCYNSNRCCIAGYVRAQCFSLLPKGEKARCDNYTPVALPHINRDYGTRLLYYRKICETHTC